jgi:hypothetical protein
MLSPVGSDVSVRFVCAPAQHGSGGYAYPSVSVHLNMPTHRTHRMGPAFDPLGELGRSANPATFPSISIPRRVS